MRTADVEAAPRSSSVPAVAGGSGPRVVSWTAPRAGSPGWVGARPDAHRDAAECSTRMTTSRCRCSAARCGRSPRRWAPCSSARRSRRTSRSGATARRRSSTSEGRLISQVEHIPVHLGAMPDAVAAVMEHDPRPGEMWILNDPYAGGTHLPTSRSSRGRESASPSAAPTMRTSAARARRACRPSRDARGGRRRDPADAARRRRRRRTSPRACATRTSGAATSAPSSLRTASPSGECGARRAPRARAGRARDGRAPRVLRASVRAGIALLPDGRYEAEDVVEAVDGDLVIRVAVTISGDEVEIDFAGTAAQHRGISTARWP